MQDQPPKSFEVRILKHGKEDKTEFSTSFNNRGISTMDITDDDHAVILLNNKDNTLSIMLEMPNSHFIHLIDSYIRLLTGRATVDPFLDEEEAGPPVEAAHLKKVLSIIKRAKREVGDTDL